ncbi:hypothetical protein [Paracoccus liaowanqingii]|nr:hypothetical protein [Paracoccus liaowanqingii]
MLAARPFVSAMGMEKRLDMAEEKKLGRQSHQRDRKLGSAKDYGLG